MVENEGWTAVLDIGNQRLGIGSRKDNWGPDRRRV